MELLVLIRQKNMTIFYIIIKLEKIAPLNSLLLLSSFSSLPDMSWEKAWTQFSAVAMRNVYINSPFM